MSTSTAVAEAREYDGQHCDHADRPGGSSPHGDVASVSLSRRFPIEQARCVTHPVDLEWVPDNERPVVPAAQANLCRRCPGRQNCLLWALAGDEPGYWGGTTSADRQQMRALGQSSVEAADWLRRRATRDQLHAEGEGSPNWYRKGCPCDECKAANAAQKRAERARAKQRAAA